MPELFLSAKNLKALGKGLTDFLYADAKLIVYENKKLGIVSEPGEDVMAFVVLRPDAHQTSDLSGKLQQHVKDRLAPYKYPRWIEFVPELPKTATGKIQRFKLRSGG